jgi:uncharacterized BrkB/YihY/UPF0761 family membrane protein
LKGERLLVGYVRVYVRAKISFQGLGNQMSKAAPPPLISYRLIIIKIIIIIILLLLLLLYYILTNTQEGNKALVPRGCCTKRAIPE